MLQILADFWSNGRLIALMYETDRGFGVMGKAGHVLWFGDEWKMSRECFAIECENAGQPTFRNHEEPTKPK